MIPPRHDFFSDPQWPLPGAAQVFTCNNTSASSDRTKEDEKTNSTNCSISLDQTLLELNNKHPSPSNSIEKLKAADQDESASSGLGDLAMKAEELL
jgi:hypothetical protein